MAKGILKAIAVPIGLIFVLVLGNGLVYTKAEKNFDNCLLVEPGMTQFEVVKIMGSPDEERYWRQGNVQIGFNPDTYEKIEKQKVFYYKNSFPSSDGIYISFDNSNTVKTVLCEEGIGKTRNSAE